MIHGTETDFDGPPVCLFGQGDKQWGYTPSLPDEPRRKRCSPLTMLIVWGVIPALTLAGIFYGIFYLTGSL